MAEVQNRLFVERVAGGYVDAIYEGEDTPVFELRHGQARLDSAAASEGAPKRVRLAIPPSVISDGVSVLEIAKTQDREAMASVVLIAGAPFGDDLHGQVAQLRAELDGLKAFIRRKFG